MAPQKANYDESMVPHYELPDPLTCADGTQVADAETWVRKRRSEILHLFEQQMYGKLPGRPDGMTCEVTSIDEKALDGRAVRKEVSVYFTGQNDGPQTGRP